ncbi:PIN domain-containing protein [Pasteurella dagmatis]|uniref:PIN-like domain-containing protein n=1 Tax=Pasteurella dagmatis ATCC 43325 TaxID=667128 RepID=C9PP78_9PAST|nr:PIN domain-containing protein [Pasteurella dagmatis]EEX50576.1 hypothetical protein HMPREF0621_0802 [Pasteurella dagmatis ATCC 43325]SNV79932.1 Uncharacterised protein [Pasteurella dagmatis]
MKYAFIDYENIHSLDNIQLNEYEKVYLFLGAQQQSITLSEKFNDQIEIRLVTIRDVAKNNLDFHLVFFLGKLDQEVDKKIDFHVISKDKGYQGICDYITHQNNARKCQLISVENGNIEKKTESSKTATTLNVNPPKNENPKSEISKPNPVTIVHDENISLIENKINNSFSAYKQLLAKTANKNLPRTLDKLINHIRSQTDLKQQDINSAEPLIQDVIEKLKQGKIIKVTNNDITYLTDISDFDTYYSYLFSKSKTRRPTKLTGLKNDIKSRLNLRNNPKAVEDIIVLLKSNNVIRDIQGEKIEYLK